MNPSEYDFYAKEFTEYVDEFNMEWLSEYLTGGGGQNHQGINYTSSSDLNITKFVNKNDNEFGNWKLCKNEAYHLFYLAYLPASAVAEYYYYYKDDDYDWDDGDDTADDKGWSRNRDDTYNGDNGYLDDEQEMAVLYLYRAVNGVDELLFQTTLSSSYREFDYLMW